MEQTLVVVSSDQLWSALTSLLQEDLAGEGSNMSLSSAGPYRVCDVTLDQRPLRLLSVALKQNTSKEDMGQALEGCFRSTDHGAVLFLLLIQGGHYAKEEELVRILQERFGAEVFKFLVVLSLERDAVVVVDVLDHSLNDLIDLCNGRFCLVTGPPATRGELLELQKMVDRALEENGAGGYSREMLEQASRSNTEDTAMGLLLEKLLRSDEQQTAFREKVRLREEERAGELEELKRSQAEEKRRETEENQRLQENTESLEEAILSLFFLSNVQDDETRSTCVILVGQSGSGKTSTMNIILKRAHQRYTPEDPGLQVPQPTTCCRRREVLRGGEKLVLVDTPELLDEDGSEDVEAVKDSLALALPGPHAFLLVLQTGRFTQGESRLLAQLPKMFGPRFAERVVVVFTHGDDDRTSEASGALERYVASAPAALREMVRRCGSRYHAVNVGSRRAALRHPQVRELLSGVGKLVASHAGEPLASKRFPNEGLRERKENMEAGF
ncbi:hypothetical protein NHX12_000046 [Muraenolepis orangiensis]|uniref:AIG1-type G domain-containing protein n=1 Tax=Muraenolepis orangiensis TaxID=630683 RepID=A0A9Q0D6S7_9TELE|nr:hypothetical protein NHX12_000046 [Muraenolepis orangiensis]